VDDKAKRVDPFAQSPFKRLIIGTAPFGFALELLLRVAIVYLFLVAAVRLLGKRMSGQVSNVELAVMLTLGAIVAVPMVSPQRGVVPGLVLLACIVLLQQGVSLLQSRSARGERLIVGRASRLLSDGVLAPAELQHAGISKQQFFSVLRAEGVRQLGELERVYLEAHGCFSVIRRAKPSPGLSILPSEPGSMRDATTPEVAAVCGYCGRPVASASAHGGCENCGHSEWRAPTLGEMRQGAAG
jgi:uncharacterized membrane protein YcaP (DUF421 family)